MLSLILSGCAQALQRAGGNSRPGLPTSTPGVETQRPAAASTSVTEPVAPQVDSTGPEAGAPGATAEAAPPAEAAPAPPAEAPPAPPAEGAAPAPAAPATAPTVVPELANVQLPTAADLEGRWRAMQIERVPFDAPRAYVSPGYQIVWWFDPIFGQIVPIGELRGEFTVQATFRLKGQWIGALELPYHVNQQYGITVPDPILKRMQQAGKGERAEVFM